MQQQAFEIPSDELQRLWVAVNQASVRMQDQIAGKLKAAGVADLERYSVLWGIEREGGAIRPRDLGKVLFLERYNITRLLDRLEGEGLVIREECLEDARGQVVRLTPAGAKLRKDTWAVYAPALADMLRGITDAEAKRAAALLTGLAPEA